MSGIRTLVPLEYVKLSSRVALACSEHPQVFLTCCYLEMLAWGRESRTVEFDGDWFLGQFGIPQPTLMRHLNILSRIPIQAVLAYRSAGSGSRRIMVTLAAMEAVDLSRIKNDTVSNMIIPCLVVKEIKDLKLKNKKKNGIKNDTVSNMIPDFPAVRPNIFGLYEANIGALTPILADVLRDAEKDYPPEWVEYAFAESVRNNARSWSYVEAILKRIKIQGFGGLDANHKLSSPAAKTTSGAQRGAVHKASGAEITDTSRAAADRINARRRAKAGVGV